jgi:hypothetical protein
MTTPVIVKLNEADVAAAIDAHKAYAQAVSKITDRMDYITRHCIKVVGGKFDWWDWNSEDYESHSAGDFMLSYDKETIQIRGLWTCTKNNVFIDKYGNEWGIEDGFPTRWLYEDFEEEFESGLKAYKEKEKQRAANAKKTKKKNEEKKKALVAAAATKLTKEERKLLGIK